jgi:hypothetical protein
MCDSRLWNKEWLETHEILGSFQFVPEEENDKLKPGWYVIGMSGAGLYHWDGKRWDPHYDHWRTL